MMKPFPLALILTCCCISPRIALAQQPWDDDDHSLSLTIPEISLISIMPVNDVVKLYLLIPGSEQANMGAGSNINSSTWINYTLVLGSKAGYKKVMVQIASGDLPKGVDLELTAEECSTGKGSVGAVSNTIQLTKSQQTLVSNIGGSCTGKGKNFGHKLTYKLVLKDLNKLEFEETDTYLTVRFTLSD